MLARVPLSRTACRMKSSLILLVFILFSFNSVVEDVRRFCVRANELAIGIVAVTLVKALLGGTDWMETLGGGAIGGVALALVRKLSLGRLGAGDVVFSALIGFSFGFWQWNACILIAAVMGIIWICFKRILWLRRISAWHIRIPFAPFMFVSAIAVALCRSAAS
jgi:prepilin signal peptidase PulO-like enzyme (type II secretory pathway)